MALPSTPCVDAPSGQRAAQRLGRRAKRASRPAPDKRKGLPFGSPLLFQQRQGSHQCRIHARNHLEKQAPLLRGCPDRGGERQAKGGARALRRNVWGDVRNARRAPRQIKKKGCLSAALFLYLAERGDCRVHPCTRPFRATRSRASLRLSDSAPAEPSNPVGGSHPPASEVSITTTTARISRTLAKKKAAQWAAFFFIWRRGGDSNPRGAINACLISSQVHSTTLPPLRVVPGGPGTRIIRGSEADDK